MQTQGAPEYRGRTAATRLLFGGAFPQQNEADEAVDHRAVHLRTALGVDSCSQDSGHKHQGSRSQRREPSLLPSGDWCRCLSC